MFKDQKQDVSQDGMAIQAGGNVTITNNGLSYSEVREVALDVFKANFLELSGHAKETARERGEEVTDKFLAKLEKENSRGLEKANDPDFQYALYTVQREYARTGDKNLGDLLVDLLVDRSKHEQRDIMQIVLNESLATAPKLTDDQLAALAIVFFFKRTQLNEMISNEGLGAHFDKFVAPFLPKLKKSHVGFQHLEFCGCGSVGVVDEPLETVFLNNYQGNFQKGFDMTEVSQQIILEGFDKKLFIPCVNDFSKMQVRATSEKRLKVALDNFKINNKYQIEIINLFNLKKMSEQEVREKCIEIRPFMAEVFEIWNDSYMTRFSLTSVGVAIAHANIKRTVGSFANLSIWIN